MRWHYQEMAAFCAFFSWCTPEHFWDLTLDEHAALVDVMKEAAKHGQ